MIGFTFCSIVTVARRVYRKVVERFWFMSALSQMGMVEDLYIFILVKENTAIKMLHT